VNEIQPLWQTTCTIGQRLRDKNFSKERVNTMAIEKKSLISTLKTTKKANVAASELNAKPSSVTSKKVHVRKGQVFTAKMSPSAMKSKRRPN